MGKLGLFVKIIFPNSKTVAVAAMLVAAILSFGFANQAQAQQTDADFSAYCRSKFNNSSYQRFAQTWGTEHACVQGGTRQGIDLGEACFLTTGSRKYEISGVRVLCDGSAGDAPAANANDLGAPDFNLYCNENFPNSIYEKRAEPNGVVHYCRRPGATGGFTLQNINLAEACRLSHGVTKYRINGDRVFCTSGSASNGREETGPAPQPNPVPAPDPNPNPDDPQPDGKEEPEGFSACTDYSGFSGGKWHGGTIPKARQLYEDALAKEALPNYISSGGGDAFAGYMEMTVLFQCHISLIGFPEGRSNEDLETAIAEACAIEPFLVELFEIVKKTGFFFGPETPHLQMMDNLEINLGELCDCEPEDVPDFAARIEELRQKAEHAVIKEFSQ